MNKKSIFSKIVSLVLCLSLFMGINVSASAIEPRASDTVSRNYSHTFSHVKNAISTDPNISINDIPEEYKRVSFQINLNSSIQYDRITGKYVSAETPTATLVYVGPVPLQLTNISTSKRDNGSSITFSYSADVIATVDTGFLIIKIAYGRVSNNFTVNK